MALYNEVILREQLRTKWLGREIIYRENINSTNDYAKEKAEQGSREGMIVFADSQSEGRGTNQKKWESPSQTGIWVSFVLKPDLTPMEARGIAILTAYSIVKVLRDQYHIPAMIKWPNDVILNGKKIAGILTEMSADKNQIFYSVVGVGINVNMKEFLGEIRDSATSLLIETGRKFSRIELLAAFLQQFERDYEVYNQHKNLGKFIDEYHAVMVNWKKEIRLCRGPNEKKVVALGLCESGELIVESEDGAIEKVFLGEVSVRGLQNYT